ncbi:MAG TPA: hypothetical protein VKU00_12455, partial [Chthonomonadaceae bacterium]|nr:hypothetical protein [Chthonomonadaceae bacterium]
CNLLDEAEAIANAGNPRETLPVFEAIADEILDHDDDFEYAETDLEDLFGDIADAWAGAILLADLTDDEREEWADRASTLAEAENIGGAARLEMVATAAEQGWDYPALVRVLQGEITEHGAWEPDEETPIYADELAKVRLDILERQGRIQEAIYLAEAEGETTRFLSLLVAAGRVQDAIKTGMEQIATPKEALALAQNLAERNETEGAFAIAEHGIHLPPPAPREDGHASFYPSSAPPKKELALWLRDYALLNNRDNLALTSGKIAFKEAQTLEDYLLLQKVSGETWKTLREELLALCRSPHAWYSSGAIDVLLHEKEFLAALKQVENSHSSDAARVAEAALATHPDEVIVLCKKRAEAIMDAGKANHYDDAQNWLRLVRDAYQAANRVAEWQTYKTSIMDTHGRKYKLIPLVRAL